MQLLSFIYQLFHKCTLLEELAEIREKIESWMFVFENGIREKFREATEINIVVTFLTQVNTAFLDNMNSIWNYNSLLNRSQN